jgi:hypothetical protein
LGPRKRWAGAFALLLVFLYWPLTRLGEPALRRAWFGTVTKALAADARGLGPPAGKIWLGASRPELPQSLDGLYELETRLAERMAIVSFYQAWGDGPEHRFPTSVLENLDRGGYLPMVTWEPWLSAFGRWRGVEPEGSLRIIADGALDGFVRAWAHAATRFGKPMLLRPGHEPTNPQYGWAGAHGSRAADYRAFWARVRRIFREEGARNVLFVWTPYGLADRDWFPGAADVDWIGFDIFNYGGLSQQGTWLDFYTITKLFYDGYRDLGPPLLLAEVATSSVGGNKSDWIRDMFRSLAVGNFPAVRALVLFDQPSGQTESGLPVNWSLGEAEGTDDVLRAEPALLAPFTNRMERQR